MEQAFGDDHSGRVLIHAALRAARRTSLPDGDQLLDFVRAHMVGPLTEELGARAVAQLLDDLASDLALADQADDDVRSTGVSRRIIDDRQSDGAIRITRDVPRVSDRANPYERPSNSSIRVRANVVLLDGDRFARASLARALVSGGCDVLVADSPLDLRSLEGELDVAIVNMATPDLAALLGALIAKQPAARVIAMSSDAHAAETLLRAVGVKESRVVPKSMRPAELGELVRRLASKT